MCKAEIFTLPRIGNIHVALTGSHAVLDIFSCHDLYFLKVVGWENKSENAPEASAADNKILISPDMKIITAGALKR